MKCGTIAICESCENGEHDLCDGELSEVLCDEHSDPVSCKCHCSAHPDNRDVVRSRNEALGLYKASVV